MAKKSDPLGLVLFMIIAPPIALIFLLIFCITGIAGLVGSVLRVTIGKKRVASHKRSSNYTKSRATRSTTATGSVGLLSVHPKSNATTKTKSTYSSINTSHSKTSASTTKRISLYEALRLPGDPDPEFGGCSIYVNVPSRKEEVVECDFDDEVEDMEADFVEAENVNEMEDILAAAAYSFMAHRDMDKNTDQDDDYEYDMYEDDEYDWETHCEYCEELLEDCECDYRHESHEAIGLWDCGCDEEDDDWGASGRDDDDHNGLCDFDKFSSF